MIGGVPATELQRGVYFHESALGSGDGYLETLGLKISPRFALSHVLECVERAARATGLGGFRLQRTGHNLWQLPRDESGPVYLRKPIGERDALDRLRLAAEEVRLPSTGSMPYTAVILPTEASTYLGLFLSHASCDTRSFQIYVDRLCLELTCKAPAVESLTALRISYAEVCNESVEDVARAERASGSLWSEVGRAWADDAERSRFPQSGRVIETHSLRWPLSISHRDAVETVCGLLSPLCEARGTTVYTTVTRRVRRRSREVSGGFAVAQPIARVPLPQLPWYTWLDMGRCSTHLSSKYIGGVGPTDVLVNYESSVVTPEQCTLGVEEVYVPRGKQIYPLTITFRPAEPGAQISIDACRGEAVRALAAKIYAGLTERMADK